jgi:hypothetical protein
MTEPYSELGGRPTPEPELVPKTNGCGSNWCRHEDGHVCPWKNETTPTGAAIPCGCTHETPDETKGK